MRVLTFNSHQPYLHLLATTLPWEIGVITPRYPSGKVRLWDERIRPIPPNVRIFPSADVAVNEAAWDWALTHNVQDLLDARNIPLPKVFLVHGTLSGRILQDRAAIDRETYRRNLERLLRASNCRMVYISALKRDDWGIPGDIIRSAIDPSPYGGYRGERRGVLQVCNHLRQRGEMLGWETSQTVCQGLPWLVLGENRDLPSGRTATDWEDLKEQYRSYRVYLYSAVYPYEDGYNLALLEAMASGMPIATVAHPTSPIEDGVQGVVARAACELRERILRLLECPEEAMRLGRAARLKIEEEFPLAAFQSAWQSLAAQLV